MDVFGARAGALEARLEGLERELAQAREEREALAARNEEAYAAEVDRGVQAAVAGILEGLEGRGIPQGAYLLQVEQARLALSQVDDLLRRVQAALVRGAGPLA